MSNSHDPIEFPSSSSSLVTPLHTNLPTSPHNNRDPSMPTNKILILGTSISHQHAPLNISHSHIHRPLDTTNTHTMVTRSEHGIYEPNILFTTIILDEPTSMS